MSNVTGGELLLLLHYMAVTAWDAVIVFYLFVLVLRNIIIIFTIRVDLPEWPPFSTH